MTSYLALREMGAVERMDAIREMSDPERLALIVATREMMRGIEADLEWNLDLLSNLASPPEAPRRCPWTLDGGSRCVLRESPAPHFHRFGGVTQ